MVDFYSMELNTKRRITMKKTEINKPIAEFAAKILKNILRIEANSTSSYIIYQPKAPKTLSRFRRKDK